MTHEHPRQAQAGLSLLELSIALAISALLVLLQLRQSNEEIRQQHLQTESAWVVAVLADILSHKGNAPDFGKFTDQTLGALRSVPSGYLSLGEVDTTVRNGFGGNVHLAPLSLGGVNNAYALNYSGITREACAGMAVALYNASAQKNVPLYGMVGNTGVTAAVPTNIGLAGDSITLTGAAVAGQRVLQASERAGLDMAQLAAFCDSASAGNGLRSLTLVRRP